MHETLLKALDELGGTGTTTEVLKYMKIVRDDAMYSACDGWEKAGRLTKEKVEGSNRNTWTLTESGYLVITQCTNMLSFKAYEKHWLDKRKKENKKSPQKDLLAPPQTPKKVKEHEPDIGPMTSAATAAVDGIAALVEENQRNTALLKNMYHQLHAIFGNQQ